MVAMIAFASTFAAQVFQSYHLAIILFSVAGVYCILRAAAPKPIPGIACNKKSARSLLGDVPRFIAHHRKNDTIFEFLKQQCYELNEPLVQVFLQPFRRPWVVIADAREAHDILNRRTPRDFDRSRFLTDLFEGTLPNHHIRMSTGEQFNRRRKLISVANGLPFIKHAAAPLMHKVGRELVDLWKAKANLANGRPFAADQDLKYTVVDISWGVITGNSPGTIPSQRRSLSLVTDSTTTATEHKPVEFKDVTKSEEYEALDSLLSTTNGAATAPIPTFYFWYRSLLPSWRRFKQVRTRTIRRGIETAMGARNAPTELASSVIECIVRKEQQMAIEEGRAPDFGSKIINDEILGFFFASETTASTLLWLVKYLAAHPDCQDSLRDRLFRSYFSEARETGELPDARAIMATKTPYLDAVIEEVLRLTHPLSAMTRRARVDTEVLGRRIPAGTDVFVLTVGSDLTHPTPEWQKSIPEHVRSKTSREGKAKYVSWDPQNVQQFCPERWLKIDEDDNESYDPKAGPTLAFSTGPRVCPGQTQAYAKLRILTTLLLWDLEFLPLPEQLNSFEYKEIPMRTPKSCCVRPVPLDPSWSIDSSKNARRDSIIGNHTRRDAKRDSMMML